MFVDTLARVIIKGGENELFRIDSVVKQACIMSPWLFNVYMDEVMKEVKMEMEKEGNGLARGWERVEIAWSLVRR